MVETLTPVSSDRVCRTRERQGAFIWHCLRSYVYSSPTTCLSHPSLLVQDHIPYFCYTIDEREYNEHLQ